MHMKLSKTFFSVVLFSIAALSSSAQEYEIRPIGNIAADRAVIVPNIPTEDFGRVMGRVSSADGATVSGATVVICNGMLFFSAKSNKTGAYSVRAIHGNHIVEAAALGYGKYVNRVDINKGEDTALDITLSPTDGHVEEDKSSGMSVVCRGNSLTINFDAKHPSFDGKSLLDVLRDTPMFTVGDDKFSVAENESVELYLNNNPFRAPFGAALKLLGSVDASRLRSVKILLWGDKSPAMVYISCDKE